jgi:hypothetical protein
MHPLTRLLPALLLLGLFAKVPLSAGPTTAAAMVGDVIALQSLANNLYVCADNGGNSPLIANRSVYSTWEEFKVIDAGGGHIVLQSLANNLYVCADNGGNSPLIANRGTYSTWEQFNVIDAGGGHIALQSLANNKYVCADNNGNSPLIANRTSYSTWEQYNVIVISSTNSIYSVPYSSIPAPTGSGVMSLRIMNATNGAYPDSQIYWAIIGQTGPNQFFYVDINGNLQPITAALNNAPGHLVKNGVNYANIYSTVSQKQWISLPAMPACRIYISLGTPCYMTTYDNGYAGPNINNPSDPNLNVYFDFVEYSLDGAGYHGNTTRVDMFGFPLQHRLVNNGDTFDQTTGELESETRAGIFSEYQNSVPSQFVSLGTVQAPYRIVAPIHGSFAAGQPNANYFAGYTSISTQDILMGVGGAADRATCAAINRHVYTRPSSDWNTVAYYYQAAPANYYAAFWHPRSINGFAYGFCYDDVNQQSSYLSTANPKGLIIRVGW